MQLLPSRKTVLTYKLTALAWMLLLVLVPCAVGMGFYTMFVMDRATAALALQIIGLALLVFVLHWLFSLRALCPRCLAGSFSRRSCSRHGSSRGLLGSHRLRVAVSVIFRNQFQCPYCGEYTAVKARSARSIRRRR